MYKKIASLFLVCVLGGYSSAVMTATLSLLPSSQIVNVGETAMVDLYVDELGSFTSPSLGAFDIELNFDSSILWFNSANFGNELGFSIQDVNSSTPGSILLTEVSLESVADLNSLQTDRFLLATLGFNSIGAGTSVINFGNVVLSDELGNIILDPQLLEASITVVPLPAAFGLFTGALFGLLAFVRRSN